MDINSSTQQPASGRATTALPSEVYTPDQIRDMPLHISGTEEREKYIQLYNQFISNPVNSRERNGAKNHLLYRSGVLKKALDASQQQENVQPHALLQEDAARSINQGRLPKAHPHHGEAAAGATSTQQAGSQGRISTQVHPSVVPSGNSSPIALRPHNQNGAGEANKRLGGNGNGLARDPVTVNLTATRANTVSNIAQQRIPSGEPMTAVENPNIESGKENWTKDHADSTKESMDNNFSRSRSHFAASNPGQQDQLVGAPTICSLDSQRPRSNQAKTAAPNVARPMRSANRVGVGLQAGDHSQRASSPFTGMSQHAGRTHAKQETGKDSYGIPDHGQQSKREGSNNIRQTPIPRSILKNPPKPGKSVSMPFGTPVSGPSSNSASKKGKEKESTQESQVPKPKDNEGHVISRQAFDRLVQQITGGAPELALEPDVQESAFRLTDEFLKDLTHNACRLAKARESETLDISDIQMVLERNYKIRIPGYDSDEARNIRKFAPTPGWVSKGKTVQTAQKHQAAQAAQTAQATKEAAKEAGRVTVEDVEDDGT